jgi:DNA-binding NarL/FixJ family response regulator
VLLLDVAMPVVSGLDALLELGKQIPDVHVVLLTAAIEPQEALRGLRLGASGVLLKTAAADHIFKCVRAVVAGQYWLGGEAFQSLLESLVKDRGRTRSDAASLRPDRPRDGGDRAGGDRRLQQGHRGAARTQ